MEAEVMFLILLGLIGVIFASITDIKKSEVPNWLSFGLIIFVLGFRFFVSLFSWEWSFFVQGLLWLGIFFVLANIFYYGRMFAGGDAKLMIGLGGIIAYGVDFWFNFEKTALFLILFFLVAVVYSLSCSFYISLRNWSEFKGKLGFYFKVKRKFVGAIVIIGFLIVLWGFINIVFFYLGLLIILMPLLYVYAKAVDEAAMIKEVGVGKLMEGDWLYKDVKCGKKIIKASWDGLSREEIKLLKKYHKKVVIREGVPFVPNFLISYIIWIVLIFLEVDLVKLIYN